MEFLYVMENVYIATMRSGNLFYMSILCFLSFIFSYNSIYFLIRGKNKISISRLFFITILCCIGILCLQELVI